MLGGVKLATVVSPPVTRTAVRCIVLVLWVLAACSVVFACLPGYDVYEGHAGGAYVGTRVAGGAAAALLATWLAVPGIVVWLHPRRALLFGWSVLAWVGFLIYFVAVFELRFDFDHHVVERWAASALAFSLGGLVVVLLMVVPAVVGLHALVEVRLTYLARRASGPAAPPIARIHREG